MAHCICKLDWSVSRLVCRSDGPLLGWLVVCLMSYSDWENLLVFSVVNWPARMHMQSPACSGWTSLPRPSTPPPGRAVCCCGSHQTQSGCWETGSSPCWNLQDWTWGWSREPEPEEPPLCPTTHIHAHWHIKRISVHVGHQSLAQCPGCTSSICFMYCSTINSTENCLTTIFLKKKKSESDDNEKLLACPFSAASWKWKPENSPVTGDSSLIYRPQTHRPQLCNTIAIIVLMTFGEVAQDGDRVHCIWCVPLYDLNDSGL